MDITNAIIAIYKQELAAANEQRVFFAAQCEIYQREIEDLKKQLKEKDNEKNK